MQCVPEIMIDYCVSGQPSVSLRMTDNCVPHYFSALSIVSEQEHIRLLGFVSTMHQSIVLRELPQSLVHEIPWLSDCAEIRHVGGTYRVPLFIHGPPKKPSEIAGRLSPAAASFLVSAYRLLDVPPSRQFATHHNEISELRAFGLISSDTRSSGVTIIGEQVRILLIRKRRFALRRGASKIS